MTPSKRFFLLIVISTHLLVLSVPAAAERLRFTPSISAKTGYDDNILFNFINRISDSYASIKPGIKGDYGTQTLQFGLDTYVDIYRYSQEK